MNRFKTVLAGIVFIMSSLVNAAEGNNRSRKRASGFVALTNSTSQSKMLACYSVPIPLNTQTNNSNSNKVTEKNEELAIEYTNKPAFVFPLHNPQIAHEKMKNPLQFRVFLEEEQRKERQREEEQRCKSMTSSTETEGYESDNESKE